MVTKDLKVKRIFYGRALKMGIVFSMVLTIALTTGLLLVFFVLKYLGALESVAPILETLGWSFSPSTKEILVASAGLMTANLVLVEIGTLVSVYLFNMVAALTGGILLTFEMVEDKR